MSHEDDGIQGGQGRTPEEIRRHSDRMTVLILCAAGAAFIAYFLAVALV